MRHGAVLVALALGCGPAVGFEANEVGLGASESHLKGHFPAAHCRPLEWKSAAADRRCDDSRATVAGINARVTFYLHRDAVAGLDVRFQPNDFEHMAANLRARYGKPAIERDGHLEWRKGEAHARLRADRERRRASLFAWRGDFERELYRIR